jgi:hypothetical protein
MPKMTKKYSKALEILGNPPDRPDQEELYHHLQMTGYFWNSAAGQWEYTDPAQADPPGELIMVRVWFSGEHVRQAARALAAAVERAGWRMVEISEPYQCRPPKQKEARVYMKFRAGE